MSDISGFGRLLVLFGVVLVALGLLVAGVGRYVPLGRLPGDIVLRRGSFAFYFPLMSSILLSLLLTILLWLFRR